MNKKVYKVLRTILVAIIIISLVLSFIVSLDHHHLETCEKEHCSVCQIIIMAQNIVNMTVAVFIFVYASFLIFFCLARMHEAIISETRTSLIFQKVQLNE